MNNKNYFLDRGDKITKDVIIATIKKLEDKHIEVTEERLVLLLYLIECNYFKEQGKRLTNLEWKFI